MGLMQIKFSDNIKPFNFSNDTKQIKVELETSYLRSEEPNADLSFDWEIS